MCLLLTVSKNYYVPLHNLFSKECDQGRQFIEFFILFTHVYYYLSRDIVLLSIYKISVINIIMVYI